MMQSGQGEIDEITDRLTKATEGSRELDETIAAFIAGATKEVQSDGRCAFHRDGFWVSIGPIRPYTTSFDAALILIPDGWRVDWIQQSLDEGYWGCGLYKRQSARNIDRVHCAGSPTVALALCIVALRARARTSPTRRM